MAWETRARGGRYYTTSSREGGRVVRRYIGTGSLAESISQLDQLMRAEREMDREIERSMITEATAEIRKIEEAGCNEFEILEALTNLLFRQAMEQAGYHQHKRGEWRKRRGS